MMQQQTSDKAGSLPNFYVKFFLKLSVVFDTSWSIQFLLFSWNTNIMYENPIEMIYGCPNKEYSDKGRKTD